MFRAKPLQEATEGQIPYVLACSEPGDRKHNGLLGEQYETQNAATSAGMEKGGLAWGLSMEYSQSS